MKRAGVLLVVTMTLVASGCMTEDPADATASAEAQGNGGPNGSHYSLNVIGVANPKSTTMDCGTGHVIFVPLTGSAQINLAEGDFQVLDCNGTDGSASFELPNPDPLNTGTTTYSVYARALGKPGGSSSQTTCATDPTTGDLFCSIYQSVQIRTKGQQTFTNVSKELLYVYYYDSTGKLVRVPLFDSSLQNYYWQYDNNGLRLLQLRFYPVSTTVP